MGFDAMSYVFNLSVENFNDFLQKTAFLLYNGMLLNLEL